MKLKFLLGVFIFTLQFATAQNVGIGTTTPLQKLDVNGTTRTTNLQVTSAGNVSDVMVKGAADGSINFKKSFNGIGLSYIICVAGAFPSQISPVNTYETAFTGEVRLFAGDILPFGWLRCEGQLLNPADYSQLYSIVLNRYGGTAPATFRLPDLRAAVPVGAGTTGTGPSWILGERTN